MSVAKRVNAAWDRIEKWYSKNIPEVKLPKGASDKDIKALETEMKVTFPEELKASLRRHDGVEEGQWTKSALLSLEGIKREWDCNTGLLKDGTFGEFKPEKSSDQRENVWWSASWIPIDSDGGGEANCIDLKPTKKGKVGQIIYFDHEIGPSGPKYDSYVDYLEAAASELEAGKYRYHKDGYLEKCSDDEEGEDEGEGDEDEEEEEEEDMEEEGEEEDEEEEEKPKKSRKKVKRN